MDSPGRDAARRYVEAVNAGKIDRLMALFADNAVLQHPTGTYEGTDAIRGFYENGVLAERQELTARRLVSEGDVATLQLEIADRLDPTTETFEAADVIVVDTTGKIVELSVYER